MPQLAEPPLRIGALNLLRAPQGAFAVLGLLHMPWGDELSLSFLLPLALYIAFTLDRYRLYPVSWTLACSGLTCSLDLPAVLVLLIAAPWLLLWPKTCGLRLSRSRADYAATR